MLFIYIAVLPMFPIFFLNFRFPSSHHELNIQFHVKYSSIRIRIKVKSWIRIRIRTEVKANPHPQPGDADRNTDLTTLHTFVLEHSVLYISAHEKMK
jgi:hypothetical protein